MDRVDDSQLKIERAREHVEVLDELIETYLTTKPYRYLPKQRPDSSELIQGVVITHEPPNQISLVAGDAIQNMRSALDHVAYRLVMAGGKRPSGRCCFPIFISQGVYLAAVSHQKRAPIDLRGVSDAAMAEIERSQPYHRGDTAANHPLWLLYQLSNIDKRRRLHITTIHLVALDYVTRNFDSAPSLGIGGYPSQARPLTDSEQDCTFWFPRAMAQAEADVYLKHSLLVVFDEEGKLRWAPVKRLLKQLIDFVALEVLPGFEHFFR
jgi:hypothetical protein